jgi:hypothetical protein
MTHIKNYSIYTVVFSRAALKSEIHIHVVTSYGSVIGWVAGL